MQDASGQVEMASIEIDVPAWLADELESRASRLGVTVDALATFILAESVKSA